MAKKKDNTWLWVAALGVGGYLYLKHNQTVQVIAPVPQPLQALPPAPIALLPPATAQTYVPVAVQQPQQSPQPVMPEPVFASVPIISVNAAGNQVQTGYATPVVTNQGNYSIVESATPINSSDNILEQQMYQKYQDSVSHNDGTWLSGPGDCH